MEPDQDDPCGHLMNETTDRHGTGWDSCTIAELVGRRKGMRRKDNLAAVPFYPHDDTSDLPGLLPCIMDNGWQSGADHWWVVRPVPYTSR